MRIDAFQSPGARFHWLGGGGLQPVRADGAPPPPHGPDCTGPCCKIQIIRTPRGTPTLRNAPVVFSSDVVDSDPPLVESVPDLFGEDDDGIEEEETAQLAELLDGGGLHAPTPPTPPPPAAPQTASPYFQAATPNAETVRPRLQALSTTPWCAATATPPPPAEAPAPADRASFVVLDTETTGFGCKDVVLQMAFGIFDVDGRLLSSYNRIWSLPPRVTISKRAFKVHKISYRRLRREGLEAAPQMRAVRSVLAQLQERGLPIVAHNASFDARLLRQTAVAHGLVGDGEWPLGAGDLFCTMKRSRKILNLPAKANPKLTKPPSNTELYRHLYKRRPGDAVGPLHDAINDCKLTALCFAAAQKRGWW